MAIAVAIIVEIVVILLALWTATGDDVNPGNNPLPLFIGGTLCAALIAWTHWHPIHWSW